MMMLLTASAFTQHSSSGEFGISLENAANQFREFSEQKELFHLIQNRSQLRAYRLILIYKPLAVLYTNQAQIIPVCMYLCSSRSLSRGVFHNQMQ